MQRTILTCLAVLLIVTGCASSPDADRSDTRTTMRDLVHLLRTTTSFEYAPYPTPRAMLRGVDIAVVGTVSSVEPALLAGGPERRGAVVVELDPEETWKKDASGGAGTVHYYIHRPTNLGIEPYRAAMADGTQVVLFGNDVTGATDFAGADPATKVYAPFPQGLFLPINHNGLVNVWGEDISDADWNGIHTLEKLREAVGQ